MKGCTVFNAEQCEGLPTHYYAKAEPPALTPMQRLEAADRFFAATGVEIRHGGTRAYYAEGTDYVHLPHFESFRDAEIRRTRSTSSQLMGRKSTKCWQSFPT
jgi:antirestriction protein ArdC